MNIEERIKETLARFDAKIEGKGWSKDDIDVITGCIESEPAQKLFGDKFASYAFATDAIAKYDDAWKFVDDFCRIIVPRKIDN